MTRDPIPVLPWGGRPDENRAPRDGLPLLLSVTLMLAAGCSSGQRAATVARIEKADLTVAVVPAVDSAGFFVALYRGLFREQGLNVRFVPAVNSETVIADQVKGQYDITGGNYVSYIQAQQRTTAASADSRVRPGPRPDATPRPPQRP
jgi:NitT/TauT family transport system substrate-binding protein